MRKIRIYHPYPIAPEQPLRLGESARHHVATVLRMKAGDELFVFHDDGSEMRCRIETINKKAVELQPLDIQTIDSESPLHITLYQALSRSDKMEWVVQKAVELGVNAIVPVLSEHSQVKLPAEKVEKKIAHWQQVSISASEQSGRCRIAQIQAPMNLAEAIMASQNDLGLILHPHGGRCLADSVPATIGDKGIALFVGPEGGFSEVEIALAEGAGIQCVQFGPRVMRTETAPLAIIAALQSLRGDC